MEGRIELKQSTLAISITLLLVFSFHLTRGQQLIPYRIASKWGFSNNEKVIVIPCSYDEVKPFSPDGLARVRLGYYWGMIDESGKVLLEPNKYSVLEEFSEGLAVVRDLGFGFIDRNFTLVVDGHYNSVDRFVNGYALVRQEVDQELLYGVINKNGKMVVRPKYSSLDQFVNGFSRAQSGHFYTLVDTMGVELFPLKYTYINNMYNDRVLVEKDGLIGIADSKGNEIVPPMYKRAFDFTELVTSVWDVNGDCSLIDRNGKVITKKKYAGIRPFHDGLARFQPHGGIASGFMDLNGNEVIPADFLGLIDFSNGYASHHEGLYWGTINRSGATVIKPSYHLPIEFHEDGIAIVMLNRKYGMIRPDGKIVVPCQYQEIMRVGDQMFAIKLNGQWGYVNEQGKVIVQPRYKFYSSFSNGLVYTDWKEGYIDRTGNEYWEK